MALNERKPIVYIPQEPMRKDQNGRWVSKGFDLASANEYGNVVLVWGPDASFLTRELVETEAMGIAQIYDEDRDFIVALGSPTLIAVLGWAIGMCGSRVRMLEWDRSNRRYFPTLRDTASDVLRQQRQEAAR